MYNVENRTKTSLFLVMLMILTPFAAASSITTFSDGSPQVEIEFKDGVSSVNTTDGGFYVPTDETITSSNLTIESEPLIFASDTRVGIESNLPIWNPVLNNQATAFDNVSSFVFEDDNSDPLPVSLSSESFITDFEIGPSGMTNTSFLTQNHASTGDPLSWQYGQKDNKVATAGPDNCASGDMCWGTTFDDDDYTDDVIGGASSNPYSWIMDSPAIYVDSSLNDTYLRFSSWHSFKTDLTPNGDYTYSDCAYLQIRTSPNGVFDPNVFNDFTHLPFNVPLSSGISPGNGYFARYDSAPSANQISYDCNGVPSNTYGLAGTSVSTTNQNGWATIAANLAPYSNSYVQIRFVLEHPDTSAPIANVDKSGWYIDDLRLGDEYVQSGELTINNVQPPVSYDEKQPNGYGVLFLDSFVPGESTLTVDVLDAVSGQVITADGAPLSGLVGPAIELWGVDVDNHPFISLKLNFSSGTSRVSTPYLYGYNIGTSFLVSFNDRDNYRGLNISEEGDWQVQDTDSQPTFFEFKSSEIFGQFNKPIYGIKVSELFKCNPGISIDAPSFTTNVSIFDDVYFDFPNPNFEFTLRVILYDDCSLSEIAFELHFGHHLSSPSVDIGNDGITEWALDEPAFGDFGRQTKFWAGELNGVSQANESEKITLDPITGTTIGAFFLLPKGAVIEHMNIDLSENSISSVNNSGEGFLLQYVIGATVIDIRTLPDNEEMDILEEAGPLKFIGPVNYFISLPNTPVFKTDQYGVEWVRIGFQVNQSDSNNGGKVTFKNLEIIYTMNVSIGDDTGLTSYLREYVATSLQDNANSGSNQMLIPTKVSADTGGRLLLTNIEILTAAGYDSSLSWNSQSDGLYPSGEVYEVVTTHEVAQSTGATLENARLRFSTSTQSIYLVYDPSAGFSTIDDNSYLNLLPSSSAVGYGSNGGKEITWKFTVNREWNDESLVYIFSETVATDGVVGMLGGITINPSVGNAVENDAGITEFDLYNSAGTLQNIDAAYSNQEIRMVGKIRLQDTNTAPDPTAYFLVVEERGLETDGENTNITWTEIANRSGVIAGEYDWTVNLGLFASGEETYRFRMTGYDGGDMVCPGSEYNPDGDCGIRFNVSIDQLDPNLIAIQIYEGPDGSNPNLPENSDKWTTIYDDSWAPPKLTQQFRIVATDNPAPPASAVMHVWVEYDHDANGNGIAEESEYIQVATSSDGAFPDANYSGSYNDYANSGLKGKVSLWVECYDLAGNPIDGGSPGLENDALTYVSMDSGDPSILGLYIDDSEGERFLMDLPNNPPNGVGAWNQTIFAGNEYHIIVEAQDANGWKDVDIIEVKLGGNSQALANYGTTLWFSPRNQSAWTDSNFVTISENPDGTSKAKMRDMNGNVLIDPFVSEFYLDLPISFDWGLPFGGGASNDEGIYTPTFSITDLRGTQIFSESSDSQPWRYSDDMQLDFRADLVNNLMITPMFTDNDEPFSSDLRKGSVYPGDDILISGQYTFIDGILDGVYINPEIPLTMEITRAPVEADTSKQYSKLDGEVTTHEFTGGVFNFTLQAPSAVNEFDYTFTLINLPTGAQDLTSSFCIDSDLYGCGKFTIKVDGTAPLASPNSWAAERGELSNTDSLRFLDADMPSSTIHCVDVTLDILEQGSLFEEDVNLRWMFYTGNATEAATKGNVWIEYQRAYGTSPQSVGLELTPRSTGVTKAFKNCVDLWPLGPNQEELEQSDFVGEITLVMWVDAVDGSGSPLIGGGEQLENGGAIPVYSDIPRANSSYDFVFEQAIFEVRNMRIIPDSPEVGQRVTLEVEVINIGSKAGPANLEVKSVTNNGIPVFEGYILSQEIGIQQSSWVTIELEEFRDTTTGMYYIVYDNGTGEPLYGDTVDKRLTFNVRAESNPDSGISTTLIVAILAGVIGILAVVVVVLSRRNAEGRDDDDDDYYEYEDDGGDGKSYANIPQQQYSAPAAAVSPQMAEAMEKFTFWTQEEIQGYFDQGWDIASLEEWLESQ